SRWRELEHQALLQTCADGGSREQAAGYFLYALEILTVAGLLASGRERRLGRVEERLEAMLSWLSATAGADGEPPPVGDDAEDRVLRDDYFAPRRADALAARARSVVEHTPSLASTTPPSAPARRSIVLPESGYAVLRDPGAGTPIRVVFDIGELGYGRLAAHGHADALSVLLDVGTTPVLRDSGTGSYAGTEGRDLFRVTAAHNTVVVDGACQADPLGPHLWGRRYRVTTEAQRLSRDSDYVRASHDGYAPTVHTRSVLRLEDGIVVVLDRIRSPADREATLVWNIGAPPRIAVAAAPAAAADCGLVPYSRRYGSRETAARLTWTARGRDVVFATVLSTAADVVPVVLLDHSAARTCLRVTAPQRVTLVEDWRSGAPQVER
ncbi:MAG TPA: heparinase II/III-family protein, partial [Gaiellaceae bacterium]|nr:heparinase II/III-family protein [Gaiellaceae bacterium]